MRRLRYAIALLATSSVAACAVVAGLDGYSEGSSADGGGPDTGVDSPVSSRPDSGPADTGPPVQLDASYDVTKTESGAVIICTQCGANCCDLDSSANWCLSNNTCGACIQNGHNCTSPVDCCSNACATGGLCASSCITKGNFCSTLAGSPCCNGLTCTGAAGGCF